jgi:hypothetical protein
MIQVGDLSTVVDQIVAFRDRALSASAACALCLEPITAKTCHVDHRPPFTFMRLWEEFKRRRPNLDLTAVDANALSGVRKFRAPLAAEQWAYFHRNNARLRLLCIRCNLSTARRGR